MKIVLLPRAQIIKNIWKKIKQPHISIATNRTHMPVFRQTPLLFRTICPGKTFRLNRLWWMSEIFAKRFWQKPASEKLLSLKGNYDKAETALTKVIDDAETKYVKEDGWILLNREKMALLLPTPHFSVNSSKTTPPAPNGMFVPTALERESYALPRFSDKAPVAKVENTTAPVPAPVSYAQTSNHSNSAPVFLSTLSFIRAIVAKDSQKVFAVLRTLRQEGKNVEDFIKSVIYELDEAYRGRLEEGIRGGNVELKTVVSAWTNDDLEEVITIFLTIIDQSYKNSLTGLKLAIMRILDLKKRG